MRCDCSFLFFLISNSCHLPEDVSSLLQGSGNHSMNLQQEGVVPKSIAGRQFCLSETECPSLRTRKKNPIRPFSRPIIFETSITLQCKQKSKLQSKCNPFTLNLQSLQGNILLCKSVQSLHCGAYPEKKFYGSGTRAEKSPASIWPSDFTQQQSLKLGS